MELGSLLLVSIASLTWAYQGGIGRGKYYNLSADKVCTWPVAPLGEAKWLWWFSWYRNNRQQCFVSTGKGRYVNADIIIYLFIYLEYAMMSLSFAKWKRIIDMVITRRVFWIESLNKRFSLFNQIFGTKDLVYLKSVTIFTTWSVLWVTNYYYDIVERFRRFWSYSFCFTYMFKIVEGLFWIPDSGKKTQITYQLLNKRVWSL